MDPVIVLLRSVHDALPEGWVLQGLRCASVGLLPHQRSERWVAEACGPNGECHVVERSTPERALRDLGAKLPRRAAIVGDHAPEPS